MVDIVHPRNVEIAGLILRIITYNTKGQRCKYFVCTEDSILVRDGDFFIHLLMSLGLDPVQINYH